MKRNGLFISVLARLIVLSAVLAITSLVSIALMSLPALAGAVFGFVVPKSVYAGILIGTVVGIVLLLIIESIINRRNNKKEDKDGLQ